MGLSHSQPQEMVAAVLVLFVLGLAVCPPPVFDDYFNEDVKIVDVSQDSAIKACESNPPPLSLNTKAHSLWINFVKIEDSSASFAATWTAETLTCCNSIMLENFDGQSSRQGLYSPMTDGTTYNGAPVYAQQDGDQQMWYDGDWAVGSDYNSGSYGILSKDVGMYCPEDVTTWTFYGSGGMTEDQDADARCSDCELYPAYDECLTCCDSVTFSSTHADWAGGWGNFFGGSYALYEAQPMLNGKAVYEMNDYCLFWECVHGYGGSWSWNGNDDPAMAATCSAECSGDPSSAPDGSTSDWDGSSNSAGTIITYTCSEGETRMAVCDAATSTWLPSTIPDCPSGGEVPVPMPTPSPTPVPPPADCIMKNKMTALKTVAQKKLRTVALCQDYCSKVDGATFFKW